MAYTKTNWVNGLTPINASNLNKIENQLEASDNAIEDLSTKNNIRAGISSDFTVNSNSNTKIPLDTVINQKGTGLTLDTTNNSVVIGSGISQVRISAQIMFKSFAANGRMCSLLIKNQGLASESVQSFATIYRSTGTYLSITNATAIVDVSEGDVIGLFARDQSSSSGGAVIDKGDFYSYLEVEAV